MCLIIVFKIKFKEQQKANNKKAIHRSTFIYLFVRKSYFCYSMEALVYALKLTWCLIFFFGEKKTPRFGCT